jgi:hypothetical protein
MTETTKSVVRAASFIAMAALMSMACAAPTPSPTAIPTPSPLPTISDIGPAPTLNPTATPEPVVVCDETAHRRTTLTCDTAVAAARSVVGSAAVVLIDVHFGPLPCPVGARCAAPPPNIGYVIFHFTDPAADLFVRVSADPSGSVTAATPLSLAFVTGVGSGG